LIGRLVLLNVLDERRENDVAHFCVAVDESSLKDGQYGRARPVGDEPTGNVRYVEVGEKLAIVSQMFSKDGLECWLCAQKSGDQLRNCCNVLSLRCVCPPNYISMLRVKVVDCLT